MNFSNLIILDSPLTTFKGKKEINPLEKEQKIDTKVKSLFFTNIAQTPKNCQIIIFDNEFPPEKLNKKLNIQVFTDDVNKGRQGFF